MRNAGKRFKQLYFLPLLMCFGMLVLVYSTAGLFPFGRNTLAWGDMVQQVLPFMVQFKDVVLGPEGALYNLANAAGMNFWGVILFFVSSPFSFLGLFVPRGHFNEFANVLVMLKMLVATGAATWYFAGRHSPFRLSNTQAGLLGVLYAFCGYTLLYYQNVVWLDELILFPFIMAALHHLLQEGKIAPFGVALGLAIVLQFQIGFMVVMTVLFYACATVLFVVPRGQKGMAALRLGVGAVLGGALSAVAWLPAVLQYTNSARGGTPLQDNFVYAKLFTHFETTFPILLCSGVVVASVLFLCFGKRLARAQVAVVLGCFLLLLVGLVIEPVNMMWHGGSYQAFPTRYGFILVFWGLMLAAAALESAEKAPAPKTTRDAGFMAAGLAAAFVLIILLFILLFHKDEANAYVRSLWGDEGSLKLAAISCGVCAVAFAVLLFCRDHKQLTGRFFAVALCLLVAMEGTYNGMLYIGGPANYNEAHTLMMDIATENTGQGGRAKLSRKYTDANYIGALGYGSIAHYSSLIPGDYITAGKKLGYSGYWMEMSGLGGTILSDSFLGIDSVICQRDGVDPAYDEARVAYENEWYALVNAPVAATGGIVVDAAPQDIATIPYGNRLHAQDWLYTTLYGGAGPLCTLYEPSYTQNAAYTYEDATREYHAYPLGGQEEAVFVYSLDIGEKQTLYFDCFRYISSNLYEIVNDGFGVWVNDVYLEASYPNEGSNGLLNLGTFENEHVEIQVLLLREEVMASFGLYGIPNDAVEQAVANVPAATVTRDGAGILQARAEGAQNSLLVLPIGFDEGLHATVNGQDAVLHKVLDGFTAVALAEGENEVVLYHIPKGFVVGLCLGGGALGVLLLLFFLQRRVGAGTAPVNRRGKPHGLQRAGGGVSLALLVAASAAVFLILYVVPLLFWLRGERLM